MYLHDDVFLTTTTAKWLYHDVAAQLPIIDFHTHLPQKEILEDHRFSNIWELWLKHDHYKWRLMRACGVPETHITGDASPQEKFAAFASILHLAPANPVHHWAHMELQRVFGIRDILSSDNATTIWQQTQNMLTENAELSVRGLLKKFNVELVCTTDDPVSDLGTHQKLASENTVTTLPTFRPDLATTVNQPDVFSGWILQLQQATGLAVTSFASMIAALKQRHDDFHAAGCRLSDHGLPYCPNGNTSESHLEQIFQQTTSGRAAASESDQELFAAAVLQRVATWNSEKNWTMQLHLGPLRNTNPAMFDQLGSDSGFDTMGAWPQTDALVQFLGNLCNRAALPRTIVYNLNPNESESICCALQNFQNSSARGKIQYGPAWWHLDHKRGIIEQLDIFASLGALGTSVGMLTDSRSFTSYVRHEYYRRLLCQYLGTAAEGGEIPADPDYLTELVSKISYHNAADWFQWPTESN